MLLFVAIVVASSRAWLAEYIVNDRILAGSRAERMDDSKEMMISGERIPVRAACHVLVSFETAAPDQAELVVEHLCQEQLLARECRPLAGGASALEIKTHPEASHIVCSLKANGQLIDGTGFDVDCGARVEATGRNFIVIGAMKAGTTTLFHLLAQHPALCRTYAELHRISFTKEVNYFNKLYRKSDTPLHYDWRFPFDPATHAWTLDVSPNYAKLPRTKAVPKRIATLEGEIKLAYILRNPVDRIESNLAHKLRTQGKLPSLEKCIAMSRYARHMDRFTTHIPRDDILLLDFDELGRDPASVQAQICDFLGIDRFVAHTVVHNQRGVEFQLNANQRAEIAEALRPDTQVLINRYGFKPAKDWLPHPT